MKASNYDLKELINDFEYFVEYAWDELGLPEPTEVQRHICRYIATGEGDRKIVTVYRNAGKSWLTSAYVTWLLLRDPDIKILVVSAGRDRATEFSAFTQKIISQFELLKHLQARPDQRCSMLAFDVNGCKPSHAPSVKSVGITSQITGSRAHYIIVDDVEISKNVQTAELREKLWHLTAELGSVLETQGKMLYLGTSHTTDGTIYDRLVLERGYNKLVIPARYPSSLKPYGGHLAPYILGRLKDNPNIAGLPTDPERFDEEELQARELAIGKSAFEMQFQLNASLTDELRYPLKLSDLIVHPLSDTKAPVSLEYARNDNNRISNLGHYGFTTDRLYSPAYVSSEWSDYEKVVMSVDPSGTGADKTGYAVVGTLAGKLHLLDFAGLSGGYGKPTLHRLADVAKRYNVNAVVVESNFGSGSYTELLKPILRAKHPCAIEESRASSQKEARIIETLEPILNQHRLVVNQEALERDHAIGGANKIHSLAFQLTHLTGDKGSLKHDDVLDAVELAVSELQDILAKNEQESYNSHKEEEFDRELESWLDSFDDVGVYNNNSLSYISL